MKNNQEGMSSSLIESWLRSQEEDNFVDAQRSKGHAEKGSDNYFKGRDIRQISEKLNRLERNFLREKEVKRETKCTQTATENIIELDKIYQKAALLIGALKESSKQETKEALRQIVSLYNHSAAEIANKQRLQKEIKTKTAKLESLISQQTLIQGQQQTLKQQLDEMKAVHWLKLRQLEEVKAKRQ